MDTSPSPCLRGKSAGLVKKGEHTSLEIVMSASPFWLRRVWGDQFIQNEAKICWKQSLFDDGLSYE
jgi:hypothetical protein